MTFICFLLYLLGNCDHERNHTLPPKGSHSHLRSGLRIIIHFLKEREVNSMKTIEIRIITDNRSHLRLAIILFLILLSCTLLIFIILIDYTALFLILSVSLSLIIRIFLYVSTSSTAYFLYFFIDNVGWVGMVG